MKIFVFDIMLKGRFVCTLRYEYCALFPIDLDELTEFILSKRPTLRNQPYNIAFLRWKQQIRNLRVSRVRF